MLRPPWWAAEVHEGHCVAKLEGFVHTWIPRMLTTLEIAFEVWSGTKSEDIGQIVHGKVLYKCLSWSE